MDVLERRTEGAAVAGREKAGMGFEFFRGDESRQWADFIRGDPGPGGTGRAEGGYYLIRIGSELKFQEGFDLEVYKNED